MRRAIATPTALTLGAVIILSAQQPANNVTRELPGDRPAANVHATRSVVMGRNGMIATSQPLASAAGLKVMQEGGNAIDAALAAAAVLAVVEPSMTGIGGDLFAIVYDAKTKTLHGLNASGRSAYTATPAEYARRGQQRMPGGGVLSVTVPGVVSGWAELLEKYGSVPMSRIVAPAVGYARDGYPVSEIISGQWRASERKLAADPVTAATFLPNGHPLQPGEIFKNPNLANTLEMIGKGGRDAFYKGPIARAIVADMKKRDGLLDAKDDAALRRKDIDPRKAADAYKAGVMPGVTPSAQVEEALQNFTGLDRGDTIYMTAADGKGNFISLIQSLFADFGSGIVAGDTGILLHNRGAGFNLTPGSPDQIAPHKRPLHTLVPAFIMKDGKPWVSYGVMGGDHQAQGHTQVVVNLIDFGMNIQEAGEAARVTHGNNE